MAVFNSIFPSNVIAFTSDRTVDFSLTADRTDLTENQKESLSARLGFSPAGTVNIRQVHGDRIIFISKDKTCVVPEVLEEADGILTDALNLPILIRTADCVPVFLYDPSRKKIGLLHAGWKGTREEILFKGLRLMNGRPENVKVAFGPAIRECCYAVDNDIQNHFPDDVTQKNGKCYLDLAGVSKKQAIKFGVKEENITDCGICTCCSENYFSYRREGESAGRMISLMMLREGRIKI